MSPASSSWEYTSPKIFHGHNTSHLLKKVQQRLCFLRRLKKEHLSPQILTNFYCCTIESVLTNCVTVWYSSSAVAERKALQKVVKTAERITGTRLPAIKDIHHQRCVRRAPSIIKDSSHHSHTLFNLLAFGPEPVGSGPASFPPPSPC